jgi:pyruvate/2-oxoglutarate dehydrogenase complex dihydrolipoamide dehydrogenase (E3) component
MAKKVGLNYTLVESEFKDNDRALAEAESEGKMKALLDKKGRLLGMQIIGSHAGELLGPALYGYRKRWSMSEIIGPVYPYPTRVEIYRRVAGTYLGPKLFNKRVRRILKALFGYGG